MKRSTLLVASITGLSAMILTAGIIYLSPLKHLNVIPPEPHDIDPKEFWTEYTAHPNEYEFLDVRAASVYAQAHAKGSISQPIGTFFDLRNDFPKIGKKIVLICSSGRLAGVGYGFLQDWGYTNVLRIKGGVQGWLLEGLPLEGTNIHAPIPTQD